MKRLLLAVLAGLVLGGGLAAIAWLRWGRPAAIVGPGILDNTHVVTIEKPVLTPGDVRRYVEAKAEAARLLEEAAAAKAEITVLTETVAQLRAQGSGPVQYVDRPVPGQPQVVHEVHFGDGRLTFDAVGDQAHYTLTQRIIAQAIMGRDARGGPTAAVRIYEDWPPGTRTEIRATTTVVAANPSAARWQLGINIQAGAALTMRGLGEQPQAGAVAGVQWLRRGSSAAAEACSWSVGTPVVYLGGSAVEIGLLPVSVNLGRLPRQPFRDLWLSPVITPHRAGLALTATF